ncbi:MAG: hypothetical protein H6706_05145 [Myxococcales bacterium]|nr:hypothetical protein [Myxococcales bacterium]
MKANASRVKRCKSFSGGAARVEVAVILDRSGRVYRADAQPPHSGTKLGSCVERAVRRFEFPAFSGEPMRIRLPYSF